MASARWRGNGRSARREHGPEALDEEGKLPEVRRAFRDVPAPQSTRGDRLSWREAALAPQELHGSRQNALRPSEATEILREQGAVRGWTELEDEWLEVIEVSPERILRHELVLPDRMQFFHGVIKVIRDRGRPRAP